jgi:hypothetical protein
VPSPAFKVGPALLRAVWRLATTPNAAVTAPIRVPTRAWERAFAAAVHRGFTISLLVSIALLFGVLDLSHSAWFAYCALACGAVVLLEGLLLAFDWYDARRFALWRLRGRATPRPSIVTRLTWMLGSFVVQGLGVAWIACGALIVILSVRSLA